VRDCPSLVGGRPAKSVVERPRGFKSHIPRHFRIQIISEAIFDNYASLGSGRKIQTRKRVIGTRTILGVSPMGIDTLETNLSCFFLYFPSFLALTSGDVRFILIPVTWTIALKQSQMLRRRIRTFEGSKACAASWEVGWKDTFKMYPN
jgi:hypothetical protein